MARGDTRRAGSSSVRTPHDRDRTAVERPSSFTSWRHQDHPISIKLKIVIRRFRGFVKELHDRGAIELRSGSLHDRIAASRSDGDRRKTRTTIVARSWSDRGSIVAQSWRNSWPFRSKIEAKLWLSQSQSGSYVLAK